MKRIFAGSLCITKQKLYVVIFVALIVAALLITSIVLYTRNIVRIDESSMPAEISGLYVGLNGNWHKALYFEPAPYNKDFGLYMQLTDFSVEVEDGSSFIETGAWTFDGEYVNIVSDSMREMQKAMEALGEEAPAYEGTDLNCTPFVRQYDILSNKWGVLLCQKEYQTNDIRRSSREWL